ncbi:hypothetical protein A2116_00865 [Candidatus Jorgensenbacteria bacterium GWA1_49_17]|uniref:Uncharacterized protein n=2 Tax=Candidatus Joergenseniibacteriota TaxID=1752739 RepID=A0A1F6BQT8_9BACT|nr:MAG: hypothetical protein A2127_00665 [Candidatus Jorgensenbacteria bacterium GWC1_48_12]OGG40025.1 MAG: hypothetical protein A2116_00865 [Candidatus Jorgensenbacteria bacterium GWA1_49_17]
MSLIKTSDVKLNNLIRKRVVELFQSFIEDTDYGLELTDRIKNRLRSPARRFIALKDLKRKYS